MKKKEIYVALIFLVLAFSSFTTNKNADIQSKAVNTNSKVKEKKTMGTEHLTKKEFLEKVMNYEKNPTEWKYLGDKPCIIDFYATWCGPCKAIAPVLEELANEYSEKIYIYKVDTDKEQELAAAFGIRSIPSLLFVPMGEQPQMMQGALPKPNLIEAIDKVLLKEKK